MAARTSSSSSLVLKRLLEGPLERGWTPACSSSRSASSRLDGTSALSSATSSWWSTAAKWVDDDLQGQQSAVGEALLGGLYSQGKVGFAFTAGYQAALRTAGLKSGMKMGDLASLLVTEETGNHPRDIRTTLEFQVDASESNERALHLSGTKTFASLGEQASRLCVLAVDGRPGNASSSRHAPPFVGTTTSMPAAAEGSKLPPPKLVMVSMDMPGEGGWPKSIEVGSSKALAFLPEVPHNPVSFHQALICEDAVLPGDGFLDYSRAFRVVEDVTIHAALIGHVLALAHQGRWSHEFVEAGLFHASALLSLADTSTPVAATETEAWPNTGPLQIASRKLEPQFVLAVAGALSNGSQILAAAVKEMENMVGAGICTPELFEAVDTWKRDFPPLSRIATRPREARRQRAWAQIMKTH